MKGTCMFGLGLLVRHCTNFQVSLAYCYGFSFDQRPDDSTGSNLGTHCCSDRYQGISEAINCLGSPFAYRMLRELLWPLLDLMAIFTGLFVEEY